MKLRHSPQIKEQALKLRNEKGWGYRRIGRSLGISPYTVKEWLHPERKIKRRIKRQKRRTRRQRTVREGTWTQKEISILKKFYRTATMEVLLKKLKGRSVHAIRTRAYHLGLHRPKHFAPKQIQELSIVQRAYLAGLIDGEGHISTYKRWIEPVVGIANCNKKLMEQVRQLVAGRIIKTVPRKKKWKTMYQVRVVRIRDIKALLEQVLPFLIVKKRQAELMLELCNLKLSSEEHTFREEMKSRILHISEELHNLNRRGNFGSD